MMAVAAVAAAFLLLPVELERFGKSVVAASLFSANFFFWKYSGYFAPAADQMPLLHTWSLAVEEQFYIFFPPLLILLRYLVPRGVVPLIALGAVVSFAVNCYVADRYQQYAFYLAPFRAWEIALGALISLGAFPAIANAAVRTVVAALGLGMILYAVVVYTGAIVYPGAAAALPCVGAALLIHTGQCGPSPIRTLLSARLLVAIGLISYSLYLWHWPLIVFANYLSFHELSPAMTAALLATSVGLAFLSWRYVETPIRQRAVLQKRTPLFAAAACSTAALIAVGLVYKLDDGLPRRVSAQALAVDKAGHDPNFDDLSCHDKMEGAIRANDLCRVGDPSVPGSWMVWGDSVAWALRPAIDAWMRENHKSGWISSRGGCPPFLGIVRRAWEPCKEPNAATLDFIARNKVDKVLFVADWPGYLSRDLRDNTSTKFFPQRTRNVLDKGADATFHALFDRHIKVYLFETIPGAKMNVPDALARAIYFHNNIDIRLSAEDYKARNSFFEEILARNSRYVAGRYAPEKILCATGKCNILTNAGLPLYSDADHPSSGAKEVFVSIFRDGYVPSAGNSGQP